MAATYAIRAKVYRGAAGWHIGSRGGDHIFPISIWTADRDIAVTIRQALRDCAAGKITREEREAIIDRELVR